MGLFEMLTSDYIMCISLYMLVLLKVEEVKLTDTLTIFSERKRELSSMVFKQLHKGM